MNSRNHVEGPLADPDDFHGLAGVYHLAAAGETPFLASQTAVFERFMADKARGMAGRERNFERVDDARRAVAGLMRVKPAEIGFPLSVAHGMNVLHQQDAERAMLLVTHYQRLLNYVIPDFVHVMIDGRIVKSGGKELALELEERGYDPVEAELKQTA